LARSRSAGDAARAVERSLAGFVPGAAVEVRLAPLRPHWSAAEEPPTEANAAPHVCPVPTVDECPAVRQATAITCEDSRRIDACHWLSDRPGCPLEAACVPVAIAGRGIGFLHVAAPLESDGGVVRIDPAAVDGVAWLAMHLGARLDPASDLVVGEGTVTSHSPTAGFSTPTGAVTLGDAPVPGDAVSLSHERDTGPFVDLTDATGEAQAGPQPQPQDSPPSWSSPAAFLRTLDSFARRGDHYVLVLGGVDDITGLAADAGYAAAEAVVAVLALALSADPDPLGPASVLACSRLDESTIAVAWSGLTLGRTVEVLEVVRGELLDSVRKGETEPCRRSFGLTHSSVSDDPEQILAAARAGLRRARALGGDQIVYADLTLLDEPPQ